MKTSIIYALAFSATVTTSAIAGTDQTLTVEYENGKSLTCLRQLPVSGQEIDLIGLGITLFGKLRTAEKATKSAWPSLVELGATQGLAVELEIDLETQEKYGIPSKISLVVCAD